MNNISDDKRKKQLIWTLAHYGAKAARLNNKQEKKLSEWILAYLFDEFKFSGNGPMKIEEIRRYIDEWENSELDAGDYKYYYVNKDNKD